MQSSPRADSRAYFSVGGNDAVFHSYDLNHGVDVKEGDTSHTQASTKSQPSLTQVSPGVSPTPTVDVNEGDTSHTSRIQVSTKSPPSLTPKSRPPHLSLTPICRSHLSPPFVAGICRPHLSHAPHAPCALLLDEACATLPSSGSSLAADPRARAETHPGTEQTLSQATLTHRTPWESCTSSGGTVTREMLSRERTGRLWRPSRATRWRSRGSGGCFLQGRESHVTLHKGSGKSHEFLSHFSLTLFTLGASHV